MLHKCQRVDVIFDVYLLRSLKLSERRKRGRGPRVKVSGSTRIPKNWSGLLQNDENKSDLFSYLADGAGEVEIPQEKTIVFSNGCGYLVLPVLSSPFSLHVNTMKLTHHLYGFSTATDRL